MDWSEQFKTLLSSPLGVELVRTLREDVHDNLIAEAETTGYQETAFGLLKEARGVIKAVEHLQSISQFAPADEGGKEE